MAASMIQARDNRQSVQLFDVDIFRHKLENYMRKQVTEMCEVVNNKKRRFSERWTEMEKESLELAEDYRDDLVYQFGKRQRSDRDSTTEHTSSSAFPTSTHLPISEVESCSSSTRPWPCLRRFAYDVGVSRQQRSTPASPSLTYLQHDDEDEDEDDEEEYDDENDDDDTDEAAEKAAEQALAMRRQLSGYSEVSAVSPQAWTDEDSAMSPCPPLSRASLSYRSDMSSCPDTPLNGVACEEAFPTDVLQSTALHASAFEDSTEILDLDIDSMAPHERSLLAALAPERFAQAELIKKAFRQSDRLLQRLERESIMKQHQDEEMQMDDRQYDQVFDELMHV